MDPAVIAARETAARLIQRAYRYYRVRHHFQNIVQLARARKGAASCQRLQAACVAADC